MLHSKSETHFRPFCVGIAPEGDNFSSGHILRAGGCSGDDLGASIARGRLTSAATRVKMLQSATTSSYLLLLLLLLPFSSSLPLLLSDLLPSQQQPKEETTSSISSSPPEPSKLSSSVTAIGDLLSNKANFLGEQSSKLGHQMELLEKELGERLKGLEEELVGKEKEEEVLRERLEDLKSDGEENAAA